MGKAVNSGTAIGLGIPSQRLVDDLGTTLLEVIEAPRPHEAEVTGAAIFDVHYHLLISPGELLLGVGVATQAEIYPPDRAAGQAGRRRPGGEGAEEIGAGLREACALTASRCWA